MKLIIAEKEALAMDISKVFPDAIKKRYHIEAADYIICWASGHILAYKYPGEIDEKFKDWKIEDLPIYFQNWEKKVTKEYLFQEIKKYLLDPQIEEILHAGDGDPEGQYLIDEIITMIGTKKPIKRIIVNDNTIAGVQKAFQKIESNEKYKSLGKAAEARSLADIILGINLSRFYSIVNRTKLSIGRVQTPTLALVVNRDAEIKNHIKEKYYELFLNTELNAIKFSLKLSNKEKIKEKTEIEDMIPIFKELPGILKVQKKASYQGTPLPYNLTRLQEEASEFYGYEPQEVMEITQSLRDKYKAITYNRSDCRYLSEEHYREAPNVLPKIAEKLELQLPFLFSKKSKCFNDEKLNAHHAIIPTLEGDTSTFNEQEAKVYRMIVERYFIQFLGQMKTEKTEVILTIADKVFKTSSNKILEKGYLQYFKTIEEKSEEEEENDSISSLSEGEYRLSLREDMFLIKEKETAPKKPYTAASLLKDMSSIAKYVKNPEVRELLKAKDEATEEENGSIGTVATRAEIIDSLVQKGFLKKEKISNKKTILLSTELAKEYLNILPESLKTADATALWWSIQEEIRKGSATVQDLTLSVLNDVSNIIQGEHQTIAKEYLPSAKEPIGKCLKCGADIHEGEKNFYCSHYKDGCDFKIWKKMKVYNQKEVNITSSKAKKLLEQKTILIHGLENKSGKEYKGNFKLEINGKYVNLTLESFVK